MEDTQLQESIWKEKLPDGYDSIPDFQNSEFNKIAREQLGKRGYTSYKEGKFYKPKPEDNSSFGDYLRDLIDKKVIGSGAEKTIIMGDYDADGTLGEAILHSAIEGKHVDEKNITVYHPLRAQNFGNLGSIKDKANPDTDLIIVDTGSNKLQELVDIQSSEQHFNNIIILDHHEVPTTFAEGNSHRKMQEKINDLNIFVVNPTLIQDMSNGGNKIHHTPLSGGGIATQFALQIADKEKIANIKVMGALATIGDHVDLIGDNVTLVEEAMDIIHNHSDQITGGLKEIIEAAVPRDYSRIDPVTKKKGLSRGIKELSVSDIAFKVIPMINSLNRMEYDKDFQARTGYKSGAEAMSDYLLFGHGTNGRTIDLKTINEFNEKRQAISRRATQKVYNYLDLHFKDLSDINGLVILGTEKEIGYNIPSSIAGLVASSVVDRTGKPAIVLSEAEENGKTVYKGSGRAPEGLNIAKQFKTSIRDIQLTGGGHPGAIGITISSLEDVEKFRKSFSKAATVARKNVATPPPDILMDFAEITPDFIKFVKQLQDSMGPTGPGNPELRFAGMFNFTEMHENEKGHLFFTAKDKDGTSQRINYFFGGRFADKIPAENQTAIYGIRIFSEGDDLSYEINIQKITNLVDPLQGDGRQTLQDTMKKQKEKQSPKEPKAKKISSSQQIYNKHKINQIPITDDKVKTIMGSNLSSQHNQTLQEAINLGYDLKNITDQIPKHPISSQWGEAATADQLNLADKTTFDNLETFIEEEYNDRLQALESDLKKAGISVQVEENTSAREKFQSIMKTLEQSKEKLNQEENYEQEEPFEQGEPYRKGEGDHDDFTDQEEFYEEEATPKRVAEKISAKELYINPNQEKQEKVRTILDNHKKRPENISTYKVEDGTKLIDQYGKNRKVSAVRFYIEELMSAGLWSPDLANKYSPEKFGDFVNLSHDQIKKYAKTYDKLEKNTERSEEEQALFEEAKAALYPLSTAGEVSLDNLEPYTLYQELKGDTYDLFSEAVNKLKKDINNTFKGSSEGFKYRGETANRRSRYTEGKNETSLWTYNEYLRQLSDYPYGKDFPQIVKNIAENFDLTENLPAGRSYSSQYQWLMHEGALEYATSISSESVNAIKSLDEHFNFSGIFTSDRPGEWLENQRNFLEEDIRSLSLYNTKKIKGDKRSVKRKLSEARENAVKGKSLEDLLNAVKKEDGTIGKEMTAAEDAFLHALSKKWGDQPDKEVKKIAQGYLESLPEYKEYQKNTVTTPNPKGKSYDPGKSHPKYWRKNISEAIDRVTDKAEGIPSFEVLSQSLSEKGINIPDFGDRTEVQKRRLMNLMLMDQEEFKAAVYEKPGDQKRRFDLSKKTKLKEKQKEELQKLKDQRREIDRNREAWGLEAYVDERDENKETRYRLRGITNFTDTRQENSKPLLYREGLDSLPTQEELKQMSVEEFTKLYDRDNNRFYIGSVLNPEEDKRKPYLTDYVRYRHSGQDLLYENNSDILKNIIREDIMTAESSEELGELLTFKKKIESEEGEELTDEQKQQNIEIAQHNREVRARLQKLEHEEEDIGEGKIRKKYKDFMTVTHRDKEKKQTGEYSYYRLHDLLGVESTDSVLQGKEVSDFSEIVQSSEFQQAHGLDTVEGFNKFIGAGGDSYLSTARKRSWGYEEYMYRQQNGEEKKGSRLKGTRKFGDLVYRLQDMDNEIVELQNKITGTDWEYKIREVPIDEDLNVNLDDMEERLLNLKALTMTREEFTAARNAKESVTEEEKLRRRAVWSLNWKDGETYTTSDGKQITPKVLEGAVSLKIGDTNQWFRKGIDDEDLSGAINTFMEDQKQAGYTLTEEEQKEIIQDKNLEDLNFDEKIEFFKKAKKTLNKKAFDDARLNKLKSMTHEEWHKAMTYDVPEGLSEEERKKYFETPEAKEIRRNRAVWGTNYDLHNGRQRTLIDNATEIDGVWYRNEQDKDILDKAIGDVRIEIRQINKDLQACDKIGDFDADVKDLKQLNVILRSARKRSSDSSPKTTREEIVQEVAQDQDLEQVVQVLGEVKQAGEQMIDEGMQKLDNFEDTVLDKIFDPDSRHDTPIQEPVKSTKRTRDILERMVSSKGHMMKPMLGFMGTFGAVTLFDAAFSKPKDDWEFYKQQRQQQGRQPIGYAW